MKMRKLTLALALVGCSVATVNVFALSLGNIELKSYLNQPLKADIPLQQIRDLTAQEVLVNLASREAFEKAGMDRSQFLAGLQFEVSLDPVTDKGVIHVQTSQPVKEPYLNFLVEVHWPSGVLVREYTLLMDPPVYAGEAAPVDATAQQPSVPSAPSVAIGTEAAGSAVKAEKPKVKKVAPMRYRVRANDALWNIATRMRPSHSVSLYQTMIAIQQMNPDAFIDGNINLLKKGKLLKAPNLKQVQAVAGKSAQQAVVHQNEQWHARASAPLQQESLEGTDRDVTPKAKATPAAGGHLELVSATHATKGSVAGVAQAAQQLALAEEKLDQSRLQLNDLQSRVKDLSTQLSTGQQLLKLKDDQLIALQGRLAELEHPSTTTEMQNTATELAEVDEPQGPSTTAVTTPASVTFASVKMLPSKVVVPSVMESPWYVNPWYWIMGTLGAAGAGFLMWRRQEQKEEEDMDDADAEAILFEESSGSPSSVGSPQENTPSASTAAEETQHLGELLGQVDIDVAYGRYQRAAKMLEYAISQYPNQMNLQLKLLELYAEMADVRRFEQVATQLSLFNDAEVNERIGMLRKRVQAHQPMSPAVADRDAVIPAESLPDFEFKHPTADITSAVMTSSDGAIENTVDDLSLDDEALDFGRELDLVAASLSKNTQVQSSVETSDVTLDLGGLEASSTDVVMAEDQYNTDELLSELDFPDARESSAQAAALNTPAQASVAVSKNNTEWDFNFSEEMGFDLAQDVDEAETKLDLAKAYLDMGDKEGARDILDEVMAEGNSTQQQQAKDLLAKVGALP